MALVEGPFLDTTVLLAGTIDMGPASRASQAILNACASGQIAKPITAWHCCLEFYAVSTRLPEDLRLTPSHAVTLLREEILARMSVVQLPDLSQLGLLELAVADRVVGGRIYDAHIAEIARHAGAQLVVTDNRRHFTALLRYGIRVLTADEYSEEIR